MHLRTLVTHVCVFFACVLPCMSQPQAASAPPSAGPQAPPPVVKLLSADATKDTISGLAPNIKLVRIKVFDSQGNPVQHSDAGVDPGNSQFVAGFSTPLAAGQIVQAFALNGDVETPASNPMAVTPAKADSAADNSNPPAPANASDSTGVKLKPVALDGAPKPAITSAQNQGGSSPGADQTGCSIFNPVEGDQTIQGYSTDKSVTVKIQQAKPSDDQSTNPPTIQIATASPDSSTHVFTLKPTDALASGEYITVSGAGTCNATVASADLYWGKVRAYFTLGLVLSQQGNDFSLNSANPFLDFTLLKEWSGDSKKSTGWGGIGLDTYFDARLTAIATTAVPTTGGSSATTSGSGSTTTNGGQNSNSNAGTGATALTPQSVLVNRQAASLQGGIYLPVLNDRYTFQGTDYSLFVAPLAKAGFYTPTSSNSVSSTSNSAVAVPVTSSRFFPFYGYGVRIGHKEELTDPSASGSAKSDGSDLLSYLDFTVGRYGNFEYTSDGCLMATGSCVRERLLRYAIEGMLKIPHTPLIIGMSANVAAQHAHAPGLNAPQDDLRFLFGAKFDARKMLGSLLNTGSSK